MQIYSLVLLLNLDSIELMLDKSIAQSMTINFLVVKVAYHSFDEL